MKITKEMLIKEKACEEQIKLFEEVFPNGAIWPDDIKKASKTRLNITWAIKKFKLTGTHKIYYDREQKNLELKSYYKKGKLNDIDGIIPAFTLWYENGVIEQEAHYTNGVLQNPNLDTPAVTAYYPNGQKRYHGYYVNGVQQNPYECRPAEKEWYEDGKIQSRSHYQNGKLYNPTLTISAYIYWDQKGNMIVKRNFINNKEFSNPKSLYFKILYKINEFWNNIKNFWKNK